MTMKKALRSSSLLLLFWYFSSFAFSNELDIEIEELVFSSHSTQLSGSLVSPKQSSIQAAVVFVHGSGKQERNLTLAKKFASAGIAAFVYDKRGVGRSAGEYEGEQSVSEKNLRLLADDASAAFAILQTHPKTRTIPKGITGISQAGWIVPLAVENNKEVDFIVLWSGPVCKVSEEDIYSKYTADRDGVEPPGFDEALKAREHKYIWPDFLGKDSNPVDSLAKKQIPGFWIFGGQDGSIPVGLSQKNLDALINAGYPFHYRIYPQLGHNNIPETFEDVIEWIKEVASP